jgi:hypothetical protein
MKRRTFLRRTGLVLGTLGIGEASLSLLGDRYYQVLAQPTRRKLALLVGINQYASSQDSPVVLPTLRGCLTDVQLQQELLHYRFGFQAADILTLTNEAATEQNVLDAFLTHLVQQAQPGDVVVFHFSGYGGQVKVSPDGAVQNSLAPADSLLPLGEVPIVNDVLESTLALLVRSLPTRQVTLVLDTSYQAIDIPAQGNLRLRSRPEPTLAFANFAELELQQRLLKTLPHTNTNGKNLERLSQLPAVVLRSSALPGQPGATAFEVQWHGFSAGAFTYGLTQHLWQVTEPQTRYVDLQPITSWVDQLTGTAQQPQWLGISPQAPGTSIYHLSTSLPEGADGVVTAVEGNGQEGVVWLAGLPASVLEHYESSSQLSLIPIGEEDPLTNHQADIQARGSQTLQIKEHSGLSAKVKLLQSASSDQQLRLQVGQWVQETVRVMPQRLGLAIALDASLQRIERVDATSALASIPYISAVVSVDQPADFLLSRVPDPITAQMQLAALPDNSATHSALSDLSSLSSGYGLLAPDRVLIASTVGEKGEAIKIAARRLVPQFQMRLTAKWLCLIANPTTSRLGVQASLDLSTSEHLVSITQATVRAPWSLPHSSQRMSTTTGRLDPEAAQGASRLPIGSQLKLQIQNYSDRPVYWMLLSTDSDTGAVIFYPPITLSTGNSTEPLLKAQDQCLSPGQILQLPPPNVSTRWIANRSGLKELYLVCSRQPLTQTFTQLNTTLSATREVQPSTLVLSNPLEVVQALLQDLHQASTGLSLASEMPQAEPVSWTDNSGEPLTLDVNHWAAFKFVYRVVG